MTNLELVRAWKDEERTAYDGPFSHPAGEIDLSEAWGGSAGEEEARTEHLLTMGCCLGLSTNWECRASLLLMPLLCMTIGY